MLRAIAGSTIRAGGATMLSAASESVMLEPKGKGEKNAHRRRNRSAEQKQSDDEEDVIGADGDVMDSRRRELLEYRERALASAGVEVHRRTRGAQNLLSCEDVSFVDVHEGLV